MRLFLGNEQMTVDQKGRVGIPARFMAVLRELYPDHCTEVGITITQDFSIKIMPMPIFEAEMARVQALSDFIESDRRIKHLTMMFADVLPLDKQNRINPNAQTMETCQISQKVLIGGSGQYMQMFDLDRWNKKNKADIPRLGEAENEVAMRGKAPAPVQYVIQAAPPADPQR